jgi:hypothetical protein
MASAITRGQTGPLNRLQQILQRIRALFPSRTHLRNSRRVGPLDGTMQAAIPQPTTFNLAEPIPSEPPPSYFDCTTGQSRLNHMALIAQSEVTILAQQMRVELAPLQAPLFPSLKPREFLNKDLFSVLYLIAPSQYQSRFFANTYNKINRLKGNSQNQTYQEIMAFLKTPKVIAILANSADPIKIINQIAFYYSDHPNQSDILPLILEALHQNPYLINNSRNFPIPDKLALITRLSNALWEKYPSERNDTLVDILSNPTRVKPNRLNPLVFLAEKIQSKAALNAMILICSFAPSSGDIRLMWNEYVTHRKEFGTPYTKTINSLRTLPLNRQQLQRYLAPINPNPTPQQTELIDHRQGRRVAHDIPPSYVDSLEEQLPGMAIRFSGPR